MRIGPHDNFFYLFAALLVFTVVAPVLTVSLGSLGFVVAEASLSATLVIALCIYFLIGAIWAILFQLLDGVSPGSFSGLEGYEAHALSWRFIYFSFVTLTTLGYGDVLPLTIYAETLVFLEAILGQFYLAVLLAGLISAYLSDRDRPLSPGEQTSE